MSGTKIIEVNSVILSVVYEIDDSMGGSESLIVTTGDGVIALGISTGQSCCENFGFFNSQGMEEALALKGMLRHIELVEAEGDDPDQIESGGTAFIRFLTDTDTIVIGVYNYHNGYYGHGITFSYDKGDDTDPIVHDMYI